MTKNRDENENRRLADALERMTGNAPQQEPASNAEKPVSSSPRSPAPAPKPRVRPAFPTIASKDPEPVSYDEQTVPIDDDRVSIAAPTPQDLISTRRAAAARSQLKSAHHSLRKRRTIVPILLTLGVMMPIVGGLWFLTDEDSPFRALSVFVPISLIFFGLVVLVVAVLNVLYLAQAIKRETARL